MSTATLVFGSKAWVLSEIPQKSGAEVLKSGAEVLPNS